MIFQITNQPLSNLIAQLTDPHRAAYSLRIEPRPDGVALKVNAGEWSPTVGTVEAPTRPVIGERHVRVFEWIVAMLVAVDQLDYDLASDRACELLVNDFGLDRDAAMRLAESAYDRQYPPAPTEFAPQS